MRVLIAELANLKLYLNGKRYCRRQILNICYVLSYHLTTKVADINRLLHMQNRYFNLAHYIRKIYEHIIYLSHCSIPSAISCMRSAPRALTVSIVSIFSANFAFYIRKIVSKRRIS